MSYNCSKFYMDTVLGLSEYCPRRKCEGLLTKVLVQYVRYNGSKSAVQEETECTKCGKVIRKNSGQRNDRHRPNKRR